MKQRRKSERRTGVIFLVLIAATNVVVWLEPVARARIAGQLAAASEIRVGLASCLLAAILALIAWAFGRRESAVERRRSLSFRLLGLRLSLTSAILNLGVIGAVLLFAPTSTGASSELFEVAVVWYLVSLPVQFAAAYSMGRGSRTGDRRRTGSQPSPAPV